MTTRILGALLGGILLLAAAPGAQAVSLGLDPSALTVDVGASFTVDIVIDGLGDGVAPSVGGFDIDLAFDPALLSVDVSSAVFTPLLGSLDPLDFETFTSVSSGAGSIGFLELSLLSSAELDALQPASFTLASVTFTALAPGSAGIFFSNTDVASGPGPAIPLDPVTGALVTIEEEVVEEPIPEPGAFVAFVAGFAAISWRLRRR